MKEKQANKHGKWKQAWAQIGNQFVVRDEAQYVPALRVEVTPSGATAHVNAWHCREVSSLLVTI